MFADGFTIAYRIDVACDYVRGTTLNINSLGEHPVAEQAGGTAGAITFVNINQTHYSVNDTVILTYNASAKHKVDFNGAQKEYTGVWVVAKAFASLAWGDVSGKPAVLTAVSHDATLAGTGASASPLNVLKTPKAVTFTGFSTGTFDGSTALTVAIPSNTNQLTNGAGFATGSGTSGYIAKWSSAANLIAWMPYDSIVPDVNVLRSNLGDPSLYEMAIDTQ